MKRTLLIILLVSLSLTKAAAQSDSLKVGDQFILSTNLWVKLDYYWRQHMDILKFTGDLIWTAKKIETEGYIEVLFVSNAADSFWYGKEKIEDDITDYRIIPLAKYKFFEKEFGKKIMNKLLKSETWIGMDWQQAMIALGYPKKINKTEMAHRIDEQWIYDGYKTKYYYFTNGKLTAIQN